MVIYKITNKINGKCYIGKTIQNFEQYKKYHIATSKNKKHKTYNKVLYKAFRKYGINNFEWEIITQCNALDELNKNEIYYIEYFDSINNGYNLTSGGDGGAINLGKSIATKNKTYEEIYGEEKAKELKEIRRKKLLGNKFGEKTKGKKLGSFEKRFGKEKAEIIKKKISKANKFSKPSKNKNKTYEEIYGEEKAKELKEARRKALRRIVKKGVSLKDRYGEEKSKLIKEKISKTLNNKRTKFLWKLTNIITKEIFIFRNKEAEEFCNNNNLKMRTMRHIAYGKDKIGHRNNWICERIIND